MVPVVACSTPRSLNRSRAANPMLSLSSPAYQTSLCRAQPINDVFYPYVFPTDAGLQFGPLLHGSKGLSVLNSTHLESKVTNTGDEKPDSLSGVPSDVRQQSLNQPCHLPTNQISIPCQKSSNQMNGSEDLRMTGSSNQRAEQLSWLAEVATGAASSRVSNLTSSSPNHEKNAAASTPVHLNSESNPRSSLGTMVFGSSPSNTRIYAPSFQSECLHLPPPNQHHHQTSAVSSSGLSLYYSQASRNTPYTNFYHADYRPPLPYHPCISDGVSQPRLSRPYFQGNAYSPITSIANVQLQSSHGAQLPHSPGYLHSATSSPMGFSPSPASPHGRMPVPSSNVPNNRTIEEQLSQEQKNSHLSLQAIAHRVSPQFHQERRSYKSPELGLSTKSPSRDPHALVYSSDSSGSKEFGQNLSPSHHCYRLPTGKEGSLKHRILRPPSINIVEPPHFVLDAPLSAPPIRTHGASSSKQLRQDSYRSISTSSSFFLDGSQTHTLVHQDAPRLSPAFVVPSESTSLPTSAPVLPHSADCKTQNLKYPPAFMKGSIIQLANSQLKPVEQMTTEDFLECEALSSNLKIDSSTVITIEKMPSSGSAKLGFSVGQNKLQITVEAPLEHPFFVYKQGWSSCSPEGSLTRYGLTCHKLKVGDTCIFLTVKSDGKQFTKPQFSVPTNRVSQSALSVSFETSRGEIVQCVTSKSLNCSLSYNSTGEKKTTKVDPPQQEDTRYSVPSFLQNTTSSSSTKTDAPAGPATRKRRWSAPEPGTSEQ